MALAPRGAGPLMARRRAMSIVVALIVAGGLEPCSISAECLVWTTSAQPSQATHASTASVRRVSIAAATGGHL